MTKQFTNILFSYNGQTLTFEKFVVQLENLVHGARIYNGTKSSPMDKETKKLIMKALAKSFDKDGM